MSRLIVNADDLGYTAGIDRAVTALHQARALSSATAMAMGAATAQDAAGWAAAELSVGAHVVLVGESAVSPRERIPTLIHNANHSAGGAGVALRPTLALFVLDLLRGRIRESEIELEAVAQIRSLQACGLRLTHIDTHKHTHMFGRVLRPLLRAARQCGIAAVRNPFEPEWARNATAGAPWARQLQVRLLASRRAGFLREVEQAGMRTTGGALGVLATGILDAVVLDRLLRALAENGAPGDTYELVCHPGFHDMELDRQPTRLRTERERERLGLLETVPKWTAGASAPHTLISFADL